MNELQPDTPILQAVQAPHQPPAAPSPETSPIRDTLEAECTQLFVREPSNSAPSTPTKSVRFNLTEAAANRLEEKEQLFAQIEQVCTQKGIKRPFPKSLAKRKSVKALRETLNEVTNQKSTVSIPVSGVISPQRLRPNEDNEPDEEELTKQVILSDAQQDILIGTFEDMIGESVHDIHVGVGLVVERFVPQVKGFSNLIQYRKKNMIELYMLILNQYKDDPKVAACMTPMNMFIASNFAMIGQCLIMNQATGGRSINAPPVANAVEQPPQIPHKE